MALTSVLLITIAGLLAILVFVFCVEIFAAVMLPRLGWLFPAPTSGIRPHLAVLVPAHNERKGLLDTLTDIKAQLRSGDRLLVVADNCTDDTAAIAKGANAEVAERYSPDKIGKGYALDWGLQQLGNDPPEVVIVIDADCRLATDSLDRLATTCAATHRPTQARYLMTAPAESSIDYRVAEFAFRIKNWVRPLGLGTLNCPCQLTGSGMAFPWEGIRSAGLANSRIVEDLNLGLDLAKAGHAPLFCPSAGVTSEFPSSSTGAKSQRKRWEQGHTGTITTRVPRLIFESLAQGNLGLLVLTFDLAVPPLTLLGLLVIVMVAISGFGFILGLSSTALVVSAASLSGYLLAVLLC